MTIARQIIAKFGGIRPMARQLGIPHTTVQGWLRYQGRIPANRLDKIVRAAKRLDIELRPEDFIAAKNLIIVSGRRRSRAA